MKLSLNPYQKLNMLEFVSLMALLMSMAALAIDAMLPALPIIGEELGVVDPNHNQFIITSLFIGMSLGMTFYGPLSDTFGRRKVIGFGITLFTVGNIVAISTHNFEIMLLGRFFQGLGAASTRIVSMAMIRDMYVGNTMARVMSLINMVFIIVPTIAPTLGAIILSFSHWRGIFIIFIVLSLFGLTWLLLRQPETLSYEHRKPFRISYFKTAIAKVFSHPQSLGYAIASGLVFGAFLGYLISSQQIFSVVFGLEKEFPYIFGGLALTIGVASFINSRLVERVGMAKLTKWGTLGILFSSIWYFLLLVLSDFKPDIISFMIFLIPCFMCVGVLFGNLNSLAMEPMGDMAGVAASIISTINNIISIGFGSLIGSQFRGTITPLVLGFLVLSTLTLITILWVQRTAPHIEE
ncbi:MAG: Bcr/CflA family drug resistance efflux transporter [Halobacteriovoraceae bacterium]|nr:Bcr/CflA family drug resistance efflux transporter [Halobacteriovoraceae bacterium]|tara:strand:- start:16142 stop:17365 length:1224 start_codon:yes stop_codon:yes gene_type:complete